MTTPEIAKKIKPNEDLVKVKALQMSVSSGEEALYTDWDGAGMLTTRKAASMAYEEAGIKNPREEISMMEVHDCFSITELATMEDLHISEPGKAPDDILDGFYDLRRPDTVPAGRRAQVLRPPDRRLRPAHALRDVQPAAGPLARGPARSRTRSSA